MRAALDVPHLAQLLALRAVATQAAALAPDPDDGALAGQRAELTALLERALEVLPTLIPDEDGGDPRREQLGDVCFAGKLELRQIARGLAAPAAPDDLRAALESARRKLRRAVRAVLEAAREAGEPDVLGGAHQLHHRVADLDSALAVRRLYAQFRRALVRPAERTPEAVLAAVRYAAGAIAALVSSPDYGDVRASDRALFRGLRDRMIAWGRTHRDVSEGLELLEDAFTTADLLRDINRRPELVAHDQALLASGPGAEPQAWLTRLEPLVGLDDAVDALLERSRAGAPPAELAPLVAARLAQLR